MSQLPKLVLLLTLATAVGLGIGLSERASAGSLITVDTTSDVSLAACTADPADCSLRGAITNANAGPSADTIEFNIPASDTGCNGLSGVCTISPAPATDLPQVTEPVMIDGLTQPDAGPGNLKIQLTGPEDPTDLVGIFITAGGSGSTIRGLVINHFEWGIQIIAAGGNIISSNYIGTDPSGTAANGNASAGLSIYVSAGGNVIGGTGPGEGNVVSGNEGYGLHISSSAVDIIKGNFVGTSAAGTAAIPNALGGIRIGNSAGTVIGGAGGGAGNVI